MIIRARVLALLAIEIMLSGCGQYIQREHTFTGRPAPAGDSLEVEVSLRGTWYESDSGRNLYATAAEPYVLRIGVLGRRLDPERMRLEDVAIVSVRGDTTCVARTSLLIARDPGGGELGTSLGTVPIGWEQLTVLGVVVGKDGSGGEHRHPFAITLKPVLKERRTSRLWARLSGA